MHIKDSWRLRRANVSTDVTTRPEDPRINNHEDPEASIRKTLIRFNNYQENGHDGEPEEVFQSILVSVAYLVSSKRVQGSTAEGSLLTDTCRGRSARRNFCMSIVTIPALGADTARSSSTIVDGGTTRD